jgi:capsular exopolysaccharide synthesis family protein
VNTLINVYLEESFRQRYESTKQVRSFLTQELETLKSKIQTEQNDLLNSESELGVWQTSAKGEDSVQLEEIEGVLAESVKAQSAEYMAQAEYDEMAQNPDAPFPSDLPGVATVNALLSSRETLRAQRASMESRYGPNYPGLVELKAQESQMDKSIAEARQQAMKGASETVQSARGEEAQLHDKLLALQAKSKAQTPKTVQLEILKAQYMSDQSLYDVLLAALGTGSIQAGLQGQALDKFVDAEVPGLKAFPILSIIGLAGGAIGLIVGLLIVGILAAVPEYRDEIAAMRIAEGDLPLVTLLAPRSAGTEAYRLLRTAITLMPTAQKHRVISLTSCGPSEGKSTTTMNLAVVLATQSKRVLLIDADLRKPTIAQRLKLPATDQPGLSRYLSDDTIEPEACIQTVPEVAGLDVIPVQEIPPFPSELLGQGRLETLLTWARDHYDYVLIDTPPTLLVTDALIVATHCDTLLTVVRIGVAQKRGLQRLRQDFAKFPGKQLGLVVNALPIADTYYGGYGNYRKYYGRKGYGSYGYGEKES